jgi:hypothetical protein
MSASSVRLRAYGPGRWNHPYFELTHDDELAIPSDLTHLKPGGRVDVRIHRVVRDETAVRIANDPAKGAALLTHLANRPRSGWRTDGADRLDDYLNENS